MIGAGPAGAAAAFWLAKSGVGVTLVDKQSFPREKTCGDGLTPRAIYQLQEMGFDFSLESFHRITGLRSYAGPELMLEMEWPQHSRFPNYGGVIRRSDLDLAVLRLAESQGASIRTGVRASPIIANEGRVEVKLTQDQEEQVLSPDYVVIADGSLNRFGRPLGIQRRKDFPLGLAARGYYRSPRSTEPFLESQLDLRHSSGSSVPGYGWVFPLGDGTINVGVGLLSTFSRWKQVNTSKLLDHYCQIAPDYWEINPDHRLTQPVGGKLTMSFSKSPLTGANWLVVGDAAGSINPWNGEGISYAYETGRMAAETICSQLSSTGNGDLSSYTDRLQTEYGLYYRTARLFVKAIGRPQIMRSLAHVGLRNRPLMEWTLKVMSNLLEEKGEYGLGERVYQTLAKVIGSFPERSR